MGRLERHAARSNGRALVKKYGIFIISAVVVTLSTVFLYMFISGTRAADVARQELMEPVAEETPPAPVQTPQPTAAPTPKPTAERFFNPSYTVNIMESSQSPDLALDYGFMTMDEAASQAVWMASEWMGVNVSDALVLASLGTWEENGVMRGMWNINVIGADKETLVEAYFSAEDRAISSVNIINRNTEYAFEGYDYPDGYGDFRLEPAFLDREEYVQAVRECTKMAKIFTLKNLTDESGTKKINVGNDYRHSADEVWGGNRVSFEIFFNDGRAYNLNYICRKGEEPKLITMFALEDYA